MGKPKILEADHQFNTNLFRNFLNKLEIKPYFKKEETNKNAVVENNIKTVKKPILKYITLDFILTSR